MAEKRVFLKIFCFFGATPLVSWVIVEEKQVLGFWGKKTVFLKSNCKQNACFFCVKIGFLGIWGREICFFGC